MPEIDTYFEVKGVLDEASMNKVILLAKEQKRVVVGPPDGEAGIFVGYPPGQMVNEDGKGYYVDDAIPTRCSRCGRVYFREKDMSWTCPACGRSGDDFQTISENVFEAAGWGNGR